MIAGRGAGAWGIRVALIVGLAGCDRGEPSETASAEPAPVKAPAKAPAVATAAAPVKAAPPVVVPTLEELLAGTTATEKELKRVAAVLRRDSRSDYSKDPNQVRAEQLADLGDRRLALLARFLTDYDLGDTAAELMNFLDRERAAPFILASMPRSDRNVQGRNLGRFVERIRDGEAVCCRDELRAAAVRCLEADTNADAAERALYAVGLTGGASDLPLLKRYAESTHPTPYWRDRLRRAAIAALARLGSEPHREHIEEELAKPVPSVIDSGRSMAIAEVVDMAAFVGDRRFLPLLCRHLDDPYPRDVIDAIPLMPAPQAALAIDQIARGTPLGRASRDVAQARATCEAEGAARGVIR